MTTTMLPPINANVSITDQRGDTDGRLHFYTEQPVPFTATRANDNSTWRMAQFVQSVESALEAQIPPDGDILDTDIVIWGPSGLRVAVGYREIQTALDEIKAEQAIAVAKAAAAILEVKFIGGNPGYQWGILVDGKVHKRGLCLPEVPMAMEDVRAELAQAGSYALFAVA